MKALWIEVAATLAFNSNVFAQIIPLPELPDSQKAELVGYLTEHWMSPEDYVVSKFKDHDIVFVGERHRVKHDVEFIQRLIPRLYQAGIFNLGIEFGSYEQQDTVDYLLSAPTYDERLARWLMFKAMTTWAYVEYEDLYRAAWELNHSLPDGAPRFRIVNINYRARWDLAREDMTPEDWSRVWFKGSSDAHMARVILDEFVKKEQKAMIYSGSHHAFTRYFQPIWDDQTGWFYRFERSRMGNIVRDSIPDRVFTVMLHHPWQPKYNTGAWTYPAGGVIDAIMRGFADQPVGFDVVGSPFGLLEDTATWYSLGYDHFQLQTWCDGYVFQKPFDRYEGCTIDTLFITDSNFREAVDFIANPSIRTRYKTPSDVLVGERPDTEFRRILEEGMAQLSTIRIRSPRRIPPPELPEDEKIPLVSFLTEHWQSPADYVISKFADRDIVFLGGYPGVRHDVEFVQTLIPRLYKAGVFNLGFAFGSFDDQDSVDYLINAPEYDEALARRLVFRERPYWALVEFQDVYRQAWTLNHSLPLQAPRFRIVNLNYREHWDLAPKVMTQSDSLVVWDQGWEDDFMARIVLDEFVRKGRKALIFSSIRNAFTRYRWAQADTGTGEFIGYRQRSMGNIISDSIPSRVFSINLHWPWMLKQPTDGFMFGYPVGGVIDALMREFESPRIGFDVVGSPFATLTDSTSVFSVGYSPFVLADFCDGYIYQKNIGNYENCTLDTLFITNANLHEAVRYFPNVAARAELRSPVDILDIARNDLDVRRRWANLQ